MKGPLIEDWINAYAQKPKDASICALEHLKRCCPQCYDKDLHDQFLFISTCTVLTEVITTHIFTFIWPLGPLFLVHDSLRLAVVTQSRVISTPMTLYDTVCLI